MNEQRNFGAIGQQAGQSYGCDKLVGFDKPTSTYGTAQYGTIAAAPVRALPDAIERLAVAMKDLAGMSDALRMRLEPVTSPPPPQAESTGYSKDCAMSSGTVAQVHQLRQVCENITAQLQDVLNRLEV